MLKKALVLMCLSALPGMLHAQATPTEKKAGDLQVGAGMSYVRPDFGTPYEGFTFYADFDFLKHVGIEGEFRQSGIGSEASEYERNYLIGPRYVFHYKRLDPYAKFLIGRGVFNFPDNTANLAYNMFAVGGGLDLRAFKHVNVRLADFEYQHWMNFQKDSLTPVVLTFGVAYHF